jgi:hypothetical protein
MRALAMIVLMGCAVERVGESEHVLTGGEDGFGFACEHVYSPTQLHTDCYSRDGERGVCAYRGICRKRCSVEGDGSFSCADGYVAVETVGKDDVTGLDNCHCEPEACAWGGSVACAATELAP